MKADLSKLSERYLAALRKHLESGSKIGLPPAAGLGRQAVALGLGTLELARIHELALRSQLSPGRPTGRRGGLIKRAKTFFAEVVTPIERTHRAVLLADGEVDRLRGALRQRTLDLSNSTRHLKRGVFQRQAAEAALKKSGKHRTRLLQESRRLQEHLRSVTREMLAAQEDERQRISRQLRDEIAQMLLGVHVRLLALRQGASSHTGNLKKEIASTQRLVKQSARTIQRFAGEFSLEHEP
jgi:signal transduction histidine kinase